GTYTVTAQVAQPTQGGADLTANVTVVVGGVGPTITCDGPSNGSMVNAAPGTLVVFTGTVSDPNGVTMVTVNGQPAPLAGGSYAATVTASYGINAVDIVADDTDGSESTRTCWFLAADNWAPEGAPFNDTVSLSLTQPAFDDGDRSGSINDFADVLQTVIDSPGLQQTLDATMRARNPLKPEGCDSQSCVFGICACNYSSGVDYLGSSLPGPNSVTLTLIDGGLAGGVVLQNVAIDLHVYGDVGPVPYDTSGTVTFDHIGVSLALDVALVNGQPQVSLRPNSVSTDVGNISTNFGGLDGWIINNIVVPLAQGSLRSAVASQLQSAISNNVDSIVGGLLSNLNVATLGTTFNVPKLDGSGTIPLSFGVGISTVDVNPARALFGLSTAFSAPPAQAFPALGVAIPDGPQLLDPAISAPDTAAATVHLAVLNQALDALWRGGMFDGALGGAALGGSQGASVAITSLLPPVADLPADGSLGVVLELGALSLEVTYPGLFGGTDANGNALPTLHVDLGATATATVALSGNALQVGSLTISQLEVSTGDLSIAGATKAAIQNLMTNLVTAYANQALTQALPALPIPSFPLPQALAQYGLPAGGQLGVVSPSLGIAPVHFVLSGQLGIW
ncbi:MAG TPA: hypothetical protein VE987_19355, partial [Polyangiaceae bacterium]|nr:hypothetical protein [Polyangiaceae bacterium]